MTIQEAIKESRERGLNYIMRKDQCLSPITYVGDRLGPLTLEGGGIVHPIRVWDVINNDWVPCNKNQKVPKDLQEEANEND